MDIVLIDGLEATIKDVVLVARYGAEARLDETAAERILAAREVVDRCVENSLVRYGITTGFGKFCDVVINEDSNALLQKNLIMSHAVGVGQPLPHDQVG